MTDQAALSVAWAALALAWWQCLQVRRLVEQQQLLQAELAAIRVHHDQERKRLEHLLQVQTQRLSAFLLLYGVPECRSVSKPIPL